MHIIKLKECAMRINKRAQIFFYFLSHFLLTISDHTQHNNSAIGDLVM